MASGGSLPLMTGTYIGTGSALTIETPGFEPKVVILVNMDDPAISVHTDKMADDELLVGTDTFAEVTSGGVTLTSTGFTVGTDSANNAASEQVHYIVMG